jgi:hypothetical protein
MAAITIAIITWRLRSAFVSCMELYKTSAKTEVVIMRNASTTQTNTGTQEYRMGNHPGLVREMAARHSRGTARVGRFCACEKLVIRRPKRSSITGRLTTRLDYQTSEGRSVSETGPFCLLFGLGRVQCLQPHQSPSVLVSHQRSIIIARIIARPCRALVMRLRSSNRVFSFPKN